MPRRGLIDLDELSRPRGVIFVGENGEGPGSEAEEEAEMSEPPGGGQRTPSGSDSLDDAAIEGS